MLILRRIAARRTTRNLNNGAEFKTASTSYRNLHSAVFNKFLVPLSEFTSSQLFAHNISEGCVLRSQRIALEISFRNCCARREIAVSTPKSALSSCRVTTNGSVAVACCAPVPFHPYVRTSRAESTAACTHDQFNRNFRILTYVRLALQRDVSH